MIDTRFQLNCWMNPGDLPFRYTRTVSSPAPQWGQMPSLGGNQTADSYLKHPLQIKCCPAGNPDTVMDKLAEQLSAPLGSRPASAISNPGGQTENNGTPLPYRFTSFSVHHRLTGSNKRTQFVHHIVQRSSI
jgi:hypothetical protein